MFVGGGKRRKKGIATLRHGGEMERKTVQLFACNFGPSTAKGPALPQAVPNTPFLTRGSGTEGIQFEDR